MLERVSSDVLSRTQEGLPVEHRQDMEGTGDIEAAIAEAEDQVAAEGAMHPGWGKLEPCY